jgi:hypothetical protein
MSYDHNKMLDLELYGETYVTHGPLTLAVKHISKPTVPFKTRASKHIVFTEREHIPDECKDYVIFNVHCEYTGIHYHGIIISVVTNHVITSKTKHGAWIDGSLAYPNYQSFLCSKLSYFENNMPDHKIYIDERIQDVETFYKKNY